eukprot:Gb_14182 [translate_table: standard]
MATQRTTQHKPQCHRDAGFIPSTIDHIWQMLQGPQLSHKSDVHMDTGGCIRILVNSQAKSDRDIGQFGVMNSVSNNIGKLKPEDKLAWSAQITVQEPNIWPTVRQVPQATKPKHSAPRAGPGIKAWDVGNVILLQFHQQSEAFVSGNGKSKPPTTDGSSGLGRMERCWVPPDFRIDLFSEIYCWLAFEYGLPSLISSS